MIVGFYTFLHFCNQTIVTQRFLKCNERLSDNLLKRFVSFRAKDLEILRPPAADSE